jgi:hypothetical protein
MLLVYSSRSCLRPLWIAAFPLGTSRVSKTERCSLDWFGNHSYRPSLVRPVCSITRFSRVASHCLIHCDELLVREGIYRLKPSRAAIRFDFILTNFKACLVRVTRVSRDIETKQKIDTIHTLKYKTRLRNKLDSHHYRYKSLLFANLFHFIKNSKCIPQQQKVAPFAVVIHGHSHRSTSVIYGGISPQ